MINIKNSVKITADTARTENSWQCFFIAFFSDCKLSSPEYEDMLQKDT